VVVAVTAVAAAGMSGRSQQGPAAPAQANQAVVMKGRAPVSKEMLNVRLPRPAEANLGNGLHLMVLEDRRAPQVAFQIMIPGAGGYFDPAGAPGLSVMTAAMMREGTTTRTTQQISAMLETMAATVNVSSSLSGLTAAVSGSSLTEHIDETFGLAADILLNPTFPAEEFDRYKTRTAAGLLQQRSSSGFLASEMFSKVLFSGHPASRASMSADALKAATPEQLAAFHKSHFVPDHALLAFAGDISMADARSLADKMLAAWKQAGTPAPVAQDPPAIGPARVSFVARPNSVQTSLWVGTQAISRTSPDYDVVSVMNAVIGGGPTGRLFVHLREEKGYTYGAYSNINAPQYRGSWLASTDVRTEVTEPALRDLMAEVARLRDELVPAAEFEDRKRAIVASFALSLESPAAVLGNHVNRWLYGLPVDYWDRLPERIAAVTPAAVQAAAKKYLDPARLQIVAVGDEAKVAPILKAFGPVDIYDTNGVKK
jgi:zinc protease